ncbi:MAG: hypothetical protein WCR36_10320 [Bacteroidaceae bacterium]
MKVKTYFFSIGFFFFLIIGVNSAVKACRFTIREIGFSMIAQTNYSVLIVDHKDNWTDTMLASLHKYNKLSNVHAILLDIDEDKSQLLLRQAKEQGIDFPNCILLGPGNRMFPLVVKFDVAKRKGGLFSEKVQKILLPEVLDSPLRKCLRSHFVHELASVVYVEGTDAAMNKKGLGRVREACEKIKNVMPLMPKEVRKAPQIVKIELDHRNQERVLLWSLGMDTLSTSPQAVVLYGRGRLVGRKVSWSQIQKGMIYKLFSIVGSDCECGLDRKWMLGPQIPLKWDAAMRQEVTSALAFDVDNPSILAEMSRIISQEPVDENEMAVSFAPEEIDLDETLGLISGSDSISQREKARRNLMNSEAIESQEEPLMKLLLITIGCLFLLSIAISIYILKKRKTS